MRAPKLGYTWTGQLAHAIRPGDPGEPDQLGLRWRASVCSGHQVLSLDELRAATSSPKFVNNKYTAEHLADLIENAPGMTSCLSCTNKISVLGRKYVPAFRELTPEMRTSVWADLEQMARQLDDVDGGRRDAWRDLQERAKAARRAQLEALAEADLLAIAAIAAASDLSRAAALLEAPEHELRAAVMRQWQRDHGVGPLVR